ncbi:MAG: sugar phosphate isomerase/epimerase [Lentisphaeria bacterium]|nr:sugar phosphate isomerase/epimerase [Lentisphaeria bacterium]NQZ71230.1 sugar phosphate isomerase/epimerase [Lentisphaeria bacterium]
MAFRYTGFADEANKDLREQCKITKEAGWDSIELRGINGTNVGSLEPDQWKEAWAILQEEGITVAGFGSQLCNWARPITTDFQVDLDELQRCIPYMKESGADTIRIMSYPNDGLSVDDWKAEVFRRIKELATIAEANGIILGHENCNGYAGDGPDECLEMLEAVNSPALKLIFDSGNNTVHDSNNESTWTYYEAVREHIYHVHIKAAKPDADGKWAMCYPDEDPVQARILADLKATNYDGWISIEPHMHATVHTGKEVSDEEAAKESYIEYTRRLEKIINAL